MHQKFLTGRFTLYLFLKVASVLEIMTTGYCF